jgi:magnesium-transporting ATPase (P-type)
MFRLRLGEWLVAGFEHARLQYLLAYLALYRAAPISRQQLAFLFWSDSTDQQALKNLHTSLTRIRHALPDADHFIDVTARTIQRRPDNAPNLPIWQTVAFATLTISELLRAFTARSERISIFKLGVFSNKTMNMAALFSVVVVLAVIYVPFLNTIFGRVPLAAIDWVWIIPFALLASVAAELTKIYLRARTKKIETNLAAQMELA